MENEQKRKYWFFGSKLNTALLAVLIILMFIAIHFMMQNKAAYMPMMRVDQSKNTIPDSQNVDVKSNTQTVKPAQTYNLSFFKPEIEKLPYAQIRQTSFEGKAYFIFTNYIPGSGTRIYSSTGVIIDTCGAAVDPMYAAKPSRLCADVQINYDSSKIVFLSANAPGNTSGKTIDIYSII